MRDTRIAPSQIHIGDVVTSDPRRDFTVADMDVDDFGNVTIYTDDSSKAFIAADQTVTIQPRRLAAQ
jgi:hypothetical protein